ncbi:MAG TPA: zf-HC2 domain-containing protein, partial [Gemmatimonadales bacterium]|nr:zf-HC2 domain-containing protein [Gemmatimonadales bacterium]
GRKDGGSMSHLDEGTLHALLDGELDLAEVSEVQKHLGGCVACGSRLQEVKQVLAESHRLVAALDVPTRAPHQPAPEPQPSRAPQTPLRIGRQHDAWDEPPVLLVPDPVDANAWRKKWLRGFRWAAMIAVVVAGGNLVSDALRPNHPMLPERDLTSAAPAVPPAVVSPEESRRPESTLATRTQRQPAAQTRTPAPRAATRREPAVLQPAAEAADQFADTTSSVAALDSALPGTESLAVESKAEVDSLGQLAAAAGAAADSAPRDRATQPSSGNGREADELATRRAAAAALAELDRERVRQRANAATAALPPPARPDPESVADPAPRPPTLEQRAQVYLRIGLDEAVKQLGGPVHVIEGMTPELIGLTRSQIFPGSSSNRPVVRVVYQDSRGRMILLDQQRMDAGQQAPTSAAGSLRWAIGDVMLYLRGEPSPEILRGLQARVR